MAGGLNRCTFIGNLGADPELKVTQGGQEVLKLRLACTESYLDRNNTRQERTEWVSATLWGKRASALSRHLQKGSRVYIEGRLQTSSFEKDGQKHYRTEINVQNLIFCGGKGEGGGAPSSGGSRTGGGSRGSSGGGGGGGSAGTPREDDFGGYGGGGDDEIPF